MLIDELKKTYAFVFTCTLIDELKKKYMHIRGFLSFEFTCMLIDELEKNIPTPSR